MKLTPSKFLMDCGADIRVSLTDDAPDSGRWSVLGFRRGDRSSCEEFTDSILEVIEADCRLHIFDRAEEEGAVYFSESPSNDKTKTPLRFNDKFNFIEPFLVTGTGLDNVVNINPEWDNSKYQLSVFPFSNIGACYLMYLVSDDFIRVRRNFSKRIFQYRCEYFERK